MANTTQLYTTVYHPDIWEKLTSQVEKNRLGHCLLFYGPSGLGKESMAWALAQKLGCEVMTSNGSPCGQCGSCLRVAHKSAEFVLKVSPEKNQIKVDQARDIIHFLELKKWRVPHVVIIDQAHLLGTAAANALLKTLEEPPEKSLLILITPFPWQLLPTIRSRAMGYFFKPLSLKQMQDLFPKASSDVLAAAAGRPAWVTKISQWQKKKLKELAWSVIQRKLHDGAPWDTILKRDDLSSESLEGFLFWGYLLIRDLCLAQMGQWDFVLNKDLITPEIIHSKTKKSFVNWQRDWISLQNKLMGSFDPQLSLDAFALT